jgi:hypothetical protein
LLKALGSICGTTPPPPSPPKEKKQREILSSADLNGNRKSYSGSLQSSLAWMLTKAAVKRGLLKFYVLTCSSQTTNSDVTHSHCVRSWGSSLSYQCPLKPKPIGNFIPPKCERVPHDPQLLPALLSAVLPFSSNLSLKNGNLFPTAIFFLVEAKNVFPLYTNNFHLMCELFNPLSIFVRLFVLPLLSGKI